MNQELNENVDETSLKNQTNVHHKDVLNRNDEVDNEIMKPVSRLESVDSKVLSPFRKEGYLLRRSHKLLRIWIRRWFALNGDKIFYKTKRNDKNCDIFTLIDDIRLCNVRANDQCERKFVFEVISVHGQHMFQADSLTERKSWIDAINSSICQSLKDSAASTYSSSNNHISDGSSSMLSFDSSSLKMSMLYERKHRLLSQSGNDRCADCRQSDPDWASINLGILLCMPCSSIHRGLGVAISRIRSLYMDEWDLETLIMMAELGNESVNSILEEDQRKLARRGRPGPESNVHTRSQFINAKYRERGFLKPCGMRPNQLLLKSVCGQLNVQMALRAILEGAEINFKGETGETALIIAIQKHSIAMVELLLMNNASTEVCDLEGASPLHHAVSQSVSFRSQVMSLIKRNAACNILDSHGLSALDYALRRKDPDVVTWLRMVNLHRQLEKDDPNVEKPVLTFLEDPAYLLEMAAMFPI